MISHKLKYTFSEDCTLSFDYEPQVVGVQVDFSTMTYTRLNHLSDDFSNISPYKDMRRCNIKNGVLQCYLGENGYKEDGTNGDVMVEIPKFYYKVVPITTETNSSGSGVQIVVGQWYICDELIDGFKVHPMFVRNGVELDYIYISAYEGSLYDTSESTFILDDSQVADFTVDTLVSIANVKPISGLSQNLTITNAEKLCVNKGEGYLQYDFTMASGLQLLMLIEYCTFDIQSKLGNGVINITDDGSSNLSVNTGETSSINNLSGYNGTNGTSSVSYHGIENPYGNIWKFVSGLNIYNYSSPKAYWSNDNKTVNTSDNHNEIGFNLCTSNGYISRIGYDENNDFVFLPTKVDSTYANSTVKDYYYQNNTYNGWTIARLGGLWDSGSHAGAFCWNVGSGSSYRIRTIGCRLAFFNDEIVKNNTTNISIDNITVLSDVNIVEGSNKLIITPTSTDGKILSINKNGKISNVVLTKGLKDFDYFKGIQSTFEENLVTDETSEHYGKYRAVFRSKTSNGNLGVTKSIYLNSPLLQGDKLVIMDGKMYHYHKMGKVVLDGSENWKDNFTNYPQCETCRYSLTNYITDGNNISSVNDFVLTDKLIRHGWSNHLELGISRTGNSIYIYNKSLSTLADFKQWLSENPTTVVYELAEPYYEEITSVPKDMVVDFYANGVVEVKSAVYPLSMEFIQFEEELTYLYTSTVYTVQFEAIGNATIDITLGGTTVTSQAVTSGLNRIQVTTPSVLVDNKLIIDGYGDCKISKVVVTNSTKEFDYFEGMKSSFEDNINEDGTYTVEIVVYNAPIRLNQDEE